MPGSLERSQIHVEGKGDFHCLIHLLKRHGVNYDSKPWPADYPEFKDLQGDVRLLDGVKLGVQLSTNRAIGFVLDADSPLSARWESVRSRLADAGVDAPEVLPAGGFVGESKTYKARAGVWLMPDNTSDGALEDFLRRLVDVQDPVIGWATEATEEALRRGAKLAEKDKLKGTLHAWLAWQEVPGCPYGTAMGNRCFSHDGPVALAFVAWFRELFQIKP